MYEEQKLKTRVDEGLAHLNRDLSAAWDDYGFEVDFNAGALGVEFEDPPAKFVISPNTPVRRIWGSANNKSYKLDWDIVQNAFVHVESVDTLTALVERAVANHLLAEATPYPAPRPPPS